MWSSHSPGKHPAEVSRDKRECQSEGHNYLHRFAVRETLSRDETEKQNRSGNSKEQNEKVENMRPHSLAKTTRSPEQLLRSTGRTISIGIIHRGLRNLRRHSSPRADFLRWQCLPITGAAIPGKVTFPYVGFIIP